MEWFGKSLNHKFTTATVVGFIISSLVFFALFLTFYQNKLENERSEAVREVNMLLQTSLENAMLKRDLDGLKLIIKRLGDQPNIRGVMIANPPGQVRFSSDSGLLDLILDKQFILDPSPQTLFTQNEQGVDVLRSINPVHNKPQCLECHGPVNKNPVNGILIVDYDATNIRKNALYTTLLLMGAGALIVIINLLGGWWFIRRFILKPVESLGTASHSLAHGDLDVRVDLTGKDELSELGESFNLMAGNLQSSMRELEESKAFLQAMVDAVPDGLRIIDKEYNTLLVNQTFIEQTACTDRNLVGEKCYKTTHGLDEPCPAELMTCPLQEIQKQAIPHKLIHHHNRYDGSVLDVEIYAAPMSIIKDGNEETLLVESIRDLTQQVSFTHEQNLTELGKLAAGVAHEIYNPLSTMKLAISSMADRYEKEQESNEFSNYISIVENNMDTCIQVTNRLLRLSASPTEQPTLVDMHLVVQDVLSLVKWDAEKASIQITESFPPQQLRVYADQGEMGMVVLNLVQNAFHAMPSGGELKIIAFEEGSDIVTRFEDDGVGIPQKYLPNIFMPFFSRRADIKHGTGLGLPISRAIMQGINGTLSVESEEGKGSSFIIRMPKASKEVLS